MREDIMNTPFYESQNRYRCPICNKNLRLEKDMSFRCKKGHCFNISSRGYINFVSDHKEIKYSKTLFESRRRVFEAGFYDKALAEIIKTIENYKDLGQKQYLLDVGCGEGFYSFKIKEQYPDSVVFGVDIVKDAIVLACVKSKKINWLVGNLVEIPFKDKSMDIILDVLTPSNYIEFKRILKYDGILVKIIPGDTYLREIRENIQSQIENKKYTSRRVTDYFEEQMKIVEERQVQYTMPVNQQQASDFFDMTPMTFHVQKEQVNLSSVTHITVHFNIIVGIKK